jgi:hypothetical protein
LTCKQQRHVPGAGGGRGSVAAGHRPGVIHVDEDRPSPSKPRLYRSVTDIHSEDRPHAADADAGADRKRQRRNLSGTQWRRSPSDHGVSNPAAMDSRPSVQHSEPAAVRGGGGPLSDEDDGSQVDVAGRRSSAGTAPGRAVVQSGGTECASALSPTPLSCGCMAFEGHAFSAGYLACLMHPPWPNSTA